MKHPWRRISAYLIDYCVILIWIAGLIILSQLGWVRLSPADSADFLSRLALQAQAFFLLTFPVILYFTLMENFGWNATLGKRLTRLRVDGSFLQIMLRNFLKFLPWELAHTAIWHCMETPFQSAPNGLAWSLFALSLGLSVIYFAGLFIGQGQPLYDRLARTSVNLSAR